MVGLNSFALREFGKESKRMPSPPPPPPLPDYFTYRFNEPFSDFDSIDDWIIEPDSAFASMERNCAQEPHLVSSENTHQPSFLKNDSVDGPEPKQEEFFKFSGLGHSRVDGPDSKFDEESQCSGGSDLVRTQPLISEVKREAADVDDEGKQCSDGSDLVRTEFQVSQVKNAGHPNGSNSTELGLEISEKLGASSLSIAEEMRKVSLGGASGAVTTSSERDGLARIGDGTEEEKLNEGVNVDSGVIEKTAATEDPTEREETEAESDEDSEFSDNEDSSSSSSEEETDSAENEDEDDDDDDDGKETQRKIDDDGKETQRKIDDDGKETQTKIDDDGEVEEGEIRDFDQEDTMLTSEDEEGAVSKGPIKSKNEIEELPNVPHVNVVLQPHHQMLPVGVVLSMVGTRVIVEGLEKHNPLNEGSILWITATRLPLGLVDEIFGPVKNPYYIVRFNSEEEVPAGIHEGTAISFVAEFANHVLNDRSLYKKGYDASGENDEEISEVAEFSDDEKEAEYRRSLRMTKKGKDRSRNQEFEGRKKTQFKVRYGNQEFEGQNKAQIHKNIKHTSSPIPVVGPPAQGMGVPFVPGHLQGPPVLAPSGCESYGCSFGSGQVGMGGPACLSQASQMAEHATGLGGHVLQPHAGWVNVIPAQQQHVGLLNCLQMNAMPYLPSMYSSNGLTGDQQFNPSHLPLPALPSPCGLLGSMPMYPFGSNGMASNQPFGPSQMPLPAAIQSPCGQLGSMPMNLPGFVGTGNGSFNQVPFGMSIQSQGAATFEPHNRPFPPTPSHGGFSAPQKFNPGVASNHRRKVFPRGGRGNFSGRRGWRPTAQ